jgi:hypothetical protein
MRSELGAELAAIAPDRRSQLVKQLIKPVILKIMAMGDRFRPSGQSAGNAGSVKLSLPRVSKNLPRSQAPSGLP